MDPGPRGIAHVGFVSVLTESCSLQDLASRLIKCFIWGSLFHTKLSVATSLSKDLSSWLIPFGDVL